MNADAQAVSRDSVAVTDASRLVASPRAPTAFQKTGVSVEVAECGHCSIATRVTQPTTGPNSCWTGVGGIGQSEFRSHQDRFATGCRAFGSSLREPLILTFVIGNDPLETVIGEELPIPHQPCLVRLDTDSEIDDGIDVRMR